ncbi:MAG: hypothetical protein EGQ22_01020 [Senegalimassilia anaerobia]|jgi:hypothetical protein|nr:hypothetical protein [Senegalimassilia anaerobia]
MMPLDFTHQRAFSGAERLSIIDAVQREKRGAKVSRNVSKGRVQSLRRRGRCSMRKAERG